MKDLLRTWEASAIQYNLYELSANLIGSILVAFCLRWFYIRFGRTHSDRKSLGDTFIMLSASVTIIMFMIKSSVALSLGLVGALSIVRFRAAIKDPEELAYILFIIAIGLGFGSSQKGVTILGVLILLPTLYIKGKFFDKVDQEKSVFLDLNTSETESKNVMEKVDEVFLKYSIAAELKRIDQS